MRRAGSRGSVGEVVDTYGEIAAGRPLQLVRSFESLAYEMTSGQELSWSHHDAVLEGVSLTFTWDPKAQAYDLAADIKSLDLDDITHRGEDMDFRALLPPATVEPGDEWSLSGPEVVGVLWPGLDWAKAKFGRTMAKSGALIEMDALFDELIEHTQLWLVYEGLREVEGKPYKVIRLNADLDYDLDISKQLTGLARAYLPVANLWAGLKFQATLTGELLWDAIHGHFHDCRMDLEFVLSGEIDASLPWSKAQKSQLLINLEASGVLRRHAQAQAK